MKIVCSGYEWRMYAHANANCMREKVDSGGLRGGGFDDDDDDDEGDVDKEPERKATQILPITFHLRLHLLLCLLSQEEEVGLSWPVTPMTSAPPGAMRGFGLEDCVRCLLPVAWWWNAESTMRSLGIPSACYSCLVQVQDPRSKRKLQGVPSPNGKKLKGKMNKTTKKIQTNRIEKK